MTKKARRSVRSFRLKHRALLGGAGATLALPFLEAMLPRTRRERVKAQEDPRVRLVWVYVPNGMIRTKLTPTDTGAGYTLSPMLEPIGDMRDHFNVLTGLSNKPGGGRYTYPDGTVSNDGPGDHARDTGTFLTCARLKKTDGSDIRNGISIDQVAANRLREYTPTVPSLVLATRSGSYGGDSGYAPIYKSNISWASETTPMDKETSPRAVFERLFAGFDPGESAAERERRQRLEQSVLDSVTDDVSSLRGRLGRQDQVKLDEYLEGIRQLEVRLETSEGMPICDPGAAPPEDGSYDFLEHVDLMFEVIRLAFQCDRTRVATLILEKPGSVYDFLRAGGSPIREAHHRMSHLEGGTNDVQRIEAINRWQVEQFGNLLRRLQGTEEGDGSTLLDNSLVMFGGGLDGTGHSGGAMGDLTPRTSGPVHRHTNLPILLGGRGGGAVRSGRHVLYERDEPLADLYISMAQAAGLTDLSSFALEGTGPLHSLG